MACRSHWWRESNRDKWEPGLPIWRRDSSSARFQRVPMFALREAGWKAAWEWTAQPFFAEDGGVPYTGLRRHYSDEPVTEFYGAMIGKQGSP